MEYVTLSVILQTNSTPKWVCVSMCEACNISASIIIIIIIWHYSPLWGFAFSAKSLHVLLSLDVSFQVFTFSFFRSSMTSSCHRCLGLPTGLVTIGFQSNSFLVGLAWSNMHNTLRNFRQFRYMQETTQSHCFIQLCTP